MTVQSNTKIEKISGFDQNRLNDICTLRNRKFREEHEAQFLSPFGCKSAGMHQTRVRESHEDEYRTAFQRDRDKIINSNSFKNLSAKRQILVTISSEHNRSRLTHTVEVAQVSHMVSRAIGLNEDLTEAIALGHDLGIPPFAHVGEQVLDGILNGSETLEGLLEPLNRGGFKHNYQSLRVVETLENKYELNGLNLTAPVREGILKHTSTRNETYQYPEMHTENIHYDELMALTLEGQVVALCDEITHRTFDLEDAIRARYLDLEEVRGLKIIREIEESMKLAPLLPHSRNEYIDLLISRLIRILVKDVINNTLRRIKDFCARKQRCHDFDEFLVMFSGPMNRKQHDLATFMRTRIGNHLIVNRFDRKTQRFIKDVFTAYFRDPLQMPDFLLKRYTAKEIDQKFNLRALSTKEALARIDTFRKDALFVRNICDYISSMTDGFLIEEYERLYLPD